MFLRNVFMKHVSDQKLQNHGAWKIWCYYIHDPVLRKFITFYTTFDISDFYKCMNERCYYLKFFKLLRAVKNLFQLVKSNFQSKTNSEIRIPTFSLECRYYFSHYTSIGMTFPKAQILMSERVVQACLRQPPAVSANFNFLARCVSTL